MSRSNKNQRGFAIVETALIVVIVAVIAFAAFTIMNRNSKTTTSNPATASTQAALPAKIQSKTDIDQSIKALDATPINNLDPNQLDGNISSLL